MNYCVLYPNTSNVNLIKEMGMIPYKLYKNYGYNSWIACYKQGEYPYLENEVKGLKIDFIEKKHNNYALDGMRYLKKNSKKIDILQIFHVTLYSFFYAVTYKKLNPKGKIYLKLDCSHKLVERIKKSSLIEKKFLKYYLSKVDLVSVEQEKLFEELKDILPINSNKLIYIPNGLDLEGIEKYNLKYNFNLKDNIILHVARIGSEEKRSEMLLEAFKKINDVYENDWKLMLVGSIESKFNQYFNEFLKENSHLKDRIILTGEINNRKELYEIYNKSKIFSLTSEFESFGFAFIEAALFGDVIVSSDVGIVNELIEEDNGASVPINDLNKFVDTLIKFMMDEKLNRKSQITRELCIKKYNWNNIISKLHDNLNSITLYK